MENEKKKIKLLLIDGNEMMRIYFRDIFWIHGKGDFYDIKMASSLEEAGKIVQDENTRPDTIFLDILMPSEDKGNHVPAYQMARSLEFISKIKKNKNLSNIKIIIYSAQKEQQFKDAASELGINGFLPKGELMPKEIIDFTDKIHEPNNKN